MNLLPLLKGKRRTFKDGQTLEVWATRDGYMGRVVRVKFTDGKIPKMRRLCLKPGAKSPTRCT